MGAVAARLSDVVIVTDDNPRSEDPAAIRRAVLAGAPGATEIGDRREAIAEAIAMARQRRHRALAGKGHEQGQIVGDQVLPFDDVDRGAGVRGMTRRCGPRAEIEAATGGRAQRAVRGHRRDLRQPRSRRRATCSWRCRAASPTGITSSPRPSPPAPPAALVSKPVDGPHVLVADVAAGADRPRHRGARADDAARSSASPGRSARPRPRKRCSPRSSASRRGKVHRSVKSYNNHTGVPLSLARMPRDSEFAVLEMGMNHAGEIAALTRLVRPHVALITTIASAHIEHLGSIEAIADAKAEIFEGLEPDGVAIIPEDTPQRDRLVKAARRHADRIVTFGSGEADVAAVHAVRAENGGSLVTARLIDSELTFTIAQRGDHWVSNALAVLAAVEAVGADLAVAGLALADMGGLKGRGERHRLRGRRRRLSADRRKLQRQSGVDGGDAEGARRGARRRRGGSRCSARCANLGRPAPRSTPTSRRRCATAKVDHLILVGDEMDAARRGARRRDCRSTAPPTPTSAAALLRALVRAARRGAGQGVQLDRACAAGRSDGRGRGLMLYLIAEQLGFPGILNLIRYISFRAGGGERDRAGDRAVAWGRAFIRWLRATQGKGQPIRADGPQSHLAKRGTPTMGGLLILIALFVSTLLWMDVYNPYVWACLLVTAGFGLIGFLDDYDKVKKAHHAGLQRQDAAVPRIRASPASPPG